MLSQEAKMELAVLTTRNGMLRAEDVLAKAKSKHSALHSQFQWDDAPAAHQHRLWQARELIIKVKVTFPTDKGKTIETRAYVSLPSDRVSGMGYRAITEVMSKVELREELLSSAMQELEAFRRRYKMVRELAAVFEAIGKVKTRKRSRKAA